MELKEMTTDQIVDSLIWIEKTRKAAMSTANVYKTELQARGLAEIEDKNIRYVRYQGNTGSCSIVDSMKLDILNPLQLKEAMPKGLFEALMDIEVTPVYKPKPKLEKALKAIFNGDYDFKHSLSDFLSIMSVKPNEKQEKVLIRKLKGEYEKDKELLCSMFPGAGTDWDVELWYIYRIKNAELIKSFLGTDVKEDKLQDIRRTILVESKMAIKIEENAVIAEGGQ